MSRNLLFKHVKIFYKENQLFFNIIYRDNMIQHLHGELNAHQSLIIQLKQQVSTIEMELAKKVSSILNKTNFFLF